MSPLRITPAVAIPDLEPVREFYRRHFDAVPAFDGAGYLLLRLGGPGAPELAFMQPRPEQPPFNGAGVMYNLEYADVDAVHARLTAAGLVPVMPLEDHPWGDRGFAVADPAGVILYCYTPIEPAPEFKQYVAPVS